MDKNTIIQLDNVSKEYRLGAIGGGTLRGDLQSFMAKIRGKDDPNLKIGQQKAKYNEKFMALSGVSFEVQKGDAIGIIGHNGAGKSTLLKLLSRVTAPTTGEIKINGRIASMLEVGTGFHPELTGRENVYLNGAILGMTRAEVAKKFDEIVAFAEMEKFIDTPVKRYSSGMYVKLAFAVAVHLDSEIMIMDEVLAVGDMTFQQKCLKKMRSVATEEGRTILYVSHNMSTVKQLCNRSIVLSKGQCIYDGDVDSAINIYSNNSEVINEKTQDLSAIKRPMNVAENIRLTKLYIDELEIPFGKDFKFTVDIKSSEEFDNGMIRTVLKDMAGTVVGTAHSDTFKVSDGITQVSFKFKSDRLLAGRYYADMSLCKFDGEMQTRLDVVQKAFTFKMEESDIIYNRCYWGNVRFDKMEVLDCKSNIIQKG